MLHIDEIDEYDDNNSYEEEYESKVQCLVQDVDAIASQASAVPYPTLEKAKAIV